MARGFLTGLVHGAILGAVVLAGLSLLAPLPVANPAIQAYPDTAPGRNPLSVDLPAGSEFGRGGDAAPRLPASSTAGPRTDSEPVAVPAPRTEPAPVAITGDNIRPDIAVEDRMPAPSVPGDVEAVPRLILPGSAPAARTQAARAVPLPDPGPGQDALPRIAPEVVSGPVAEPVQGIAPLPTPALPAPALDLSLPPDLTDLRRLERN